MGEDPAPPEPYTLSTRLAPVPGATAEARRFLWSTIARYGIPAERETASLLLSELVSNAVIHADPNDPIDVSVTVDGERLHVSVRDPGPPFDPIEAARAPGPSGLTIVDRLSSRWGGRAADDGMEVWFEV
jgi:anti-sigma regulatory factor (Ser/Thr protein kinase)